MILGTPTCRIIAIFSIIAPPSFWADKASSRSKHSEAICIRSIVSVGAAIGTPLDPLLRPRPQEVCGPSPKPPAVPPATPNRPSAPLPPPSEALKRLTPALRSNTKAIALILL